MEKSCKNCEISFNTEIKNQVFCSRSCRNKYWSNRYYRKNKQKILLGMKTDEYRAKERERSKSPHIRDYHNNYSRNRRRSDSSYKLKMCINDRIRKDDRFKDAYRIAELEAYLGQTIDEILAHLLLKLPEGLCEQSFLHGDLHLDHVIPYSWYVVRFLGDKEFRKCWDKRNLRLIPIKMNLKRGRKYMDWEDLSKKGMIDLFPSGAHEVFGRFHGTKVGAT